jgi:hypothetical protein
VVCITSSVEPVGITTESSVDERVIRLDRDLDVTGLSSNVITKSEEVIPIIDGIVAIIVN